jgi:hypothetical protein
VNRQDENLTECYVGMDVVLLVGYEALTSYLAPQSKNFSAAPMRTERLCLVPSFMDLVYIFPSLEVSPLGIFEGAGWIMVLIKVLCVE